MSNAREEVYEAFAERSYKSPGGKSIYIHIDDALAFVDLCEEKSLIITGFDGIYCENDGLYFPIDLITEINFSRGDRSWQEYQSFMISHAREAVSNNLPNDKNLYVDFVVLTEERYNEIHPEFIKSKK